MFGAERDGALTLAFLDVGSGKMDPPRLIETSEIGWVSCFLHRRWDEPDLEGNCMFPECSAIQVAFGAFEVPARWECLQKTGDVSPTEFHNSTVTVQADSGHHRHSTGSKKLHSTPIFTPLSPLSQLPIIPPPPLQNPTPPPPFPIKPISTDVLLLFTFGPHLASVLSTSGPICG